MSIDLERIKSIIESLIFVSDEPIECKQLKAILEGVTNKELKQAIDELLVEHATKNRGFHLIEVAEGYQFRSRSENGDWIRRLINEKPQRMSQASLEALAIVAYRQPVTRPEIEKIRRVDSGGVLNTLLQKNLIRILGRKDEPGKPFIYGTTREFLELFNLKDLAALPSLREIQDLAGAKEMEEALADLAPDQIEGEPESAPVESEQVDAAAAEAEVPADPQAGSEEDGHGE